MSPSDGTGSSQGRDRDEGIVLPSWIDQAIAKTGGSDTSPEVAEPAYQDDPVDSPDYVDEPAPRTREPLELEATADSLEADTDERVEEYADESTYAAYETLPDEATDAAEGSRDDEELNPDEAYESPRPSIEPFPSFLDRRTPQFSEPVAEAETEPTPSALTERLRMAAAPSRVTYDDFEEKRAAIVSEALAEPIDPVDPVESLPVAPRSEAIPLPIAPPRRRAPTGPWLMAAIFFAAAAIVLAVLIWLRPLQQ